MKPWLFNLLACPICKDFPLKLFIFSFESKEEEFKEYIEDYEERDLSYYQTHKIPAIIEEDQIYLKDNIIVEQTPLKKYINDLISILEELEYIRDKSPYDLSKECFNLAGGKIKETVLDWREEIESNDIKTLLPEIIFLNRLLVETEIEAGLLFCNNCHRWFPIVDTIPRMLPDEYRSKEKELEFLNAHKDKLEKDFLNLDLKPFTIHS